MKTYGKSEKVVLMIGDKVIHEGVTTSDIKADTYIRHAYTGEERPVTLINYNEYFVGTKVKTQDGDVHDVITLYSNNKPIHWTTLSDGGSWEVLDNEV